MPQGTSRAFGLSKRRGVQLTPSAGAIPAIDIVIGDNRIARRVREVQLRAPSVIPYRGYIQFA